MIYLVGIGLIILLSLGLAALLYRGKAKAEQHHAALQQQRADAAESVNNNRQQLDTALETIHETHREETLHANNPTHLAERDDFANAWSGTDRLHSTGTDTDHATSAAASGSTGSAVHFVNRPDLG
jgi:type II secretory pathway pseudopilin PulG